jgi:hypothetical protein
MSILQSIIDGASIYQSVSATDCAMWICDAEGVVVHCQPAKTFDMTVEVGTKVKENGLMDKSMKTRQEINMVIPKDWYGKTCRAICHPIYEDSNVIGAIAMGTSLETQEILHTAAQSIAATTEQMCATSEEIAATATQLATDLDTLKAASEEVISNIGKTDEILKFVSDVAASSNLLGLNAAIEAARAGEHGRGFAVVAEEIRKMADNSAQAVKDIKTILETIRSKSNVMTKTVLTTAQLSERQAAANEEISASMQQLNATASNVEKMAQIV